MNLTLLFVFGVIILVIFSIISNTGSSSINNISFQFHKITCPLPLSKGVDYLNGTIIYDTDINGSATDIEQEKVGTFYKCTQDSITGNLITTTVIKEYNANCFDVIPCGILGYWGDYLSILTEKALAIFTLIAYVLTPINFSILGYTIMDIGAVALIFVIGLYAFCYIVIGVWIYKAVIPHGGIS